MTFELQFIKTIVAFYSQNHLKRGSPLVVKVLKLEIFYILQMR